MCREELLKYLVRHNHLWSYDNKQAKHLPDSILIEHALLYSDVEGLILLFECFEKNEIQQVWEAKIVPHQRYRKLNLYLGIFFFKVPNIQSFLQQNTLEYPRLERLRLLASENETGTA